MLLEKITATIDCEASGTQRNKANPFDPRNKLVSAGVLREGNYLGTMVEQGAAPYGDSVATLAKSLEGVEWLIAFNAKYDLHWLRRYGTANSPTSS
jgi:hypothetical protein